MKNIKVTSLVVSILLIEASCVFACAPDFDSAYFVRSSKEKFLAVPEGDFLFELKRTGGDKKPLNIELVPSQRVSDADMADLKQALQERKTIGADFDGAVESYKKSRDSINSFLESCPVEDSSAFYGGRFRSQERIVAEHKKNFLGTQEYLSVELPEHLANKDYVYNYLSEEKTVTKNYTEPELILTSSVPEEFQLYLKGAAKYHFNDFAAAIKLWEQILKLPESERKYKSVWAAFMLGKAYLNPSNQKEAIAYFIQARELAKIGFSDSMNLAFESLGWQALAEFESGDQVSSIRHYLEVMDVNSLNWVCNKISGTKDKTIEKVVKDKTARDVLLGWAVSRPFWNEMEWGEDKTYSDFFGRLLQAIEKVKDPDPIGYADRVAWLYYIKGDATNAKRWIVFSKNATPLAQFVDYKLTLRDGNIEEAIQKLSKVMLAFEKSRDKDMFFQEDTERMLNSDMAALKLGRKEYLMAFNLLLKGKFWEDIAYVAEKVLTTQELEDFLKENKSNPVLANKQKMYEGYYIYVLNRIKTHPDEKEWYADSLKDDGLTLGESLEYLLARRLAREGLWDKAIDYMPKGMMTIDRGWIEKKKEGADSEYEQVSEDFNPKFKLIELKNNILKGQNEQLSKTERAKAYYSAGVIMRKYGMELVGTELDPDGYVDRGAYPYYGSIENRFGILVDEAKADYEQWNKEEIAKKANLRELIRKNRGFFYGSEDEEDRAMSSLPKPNKRFHYRYKAADLMWKSAELLPDDDELKAKALCAGGTFIKTRDPKYAEKFYKALVKTCGKTELGKQADKLRWFPKMSIYD